VLGRSKAVEQECTEFPYLTAPNPAGSDVFRAARPSSPGRHRKEEGDAMGKSTKITENTRNPVRHAAAPLPRTSAASACMLAYSSSVSAPRAACRSAAQREPAPSSSALRFTAARQRLGQAVADDRPVLGVQVRDHGVPESASARRRAGVHGTPASAGGHDGQDAASVGVGQDGEGAIPGHGGRSARQRRHGRAHRSPAGAVAAVAGVRSWATPYRDGDGQQLVVGDGGLRNVTRCGRG
jgi:hypothetical protein